MACQQNTVAVVGSGGAIGSALVPLVARQPAVQRLVLIDFDVYEAANLASQQIDWSSVGLPKVVAQERRVRQINPAMEVLTARERVEHVPAGLLLAAVVIACVDSRAARQTVNQLAWMLGVPWIDTGIDGAALQARVGLFVPGPSTACLECAWGPRDYAALEQRTSCTDSAMVAPTRAPAALGTFAASLAALECQQLMTGDDVPLLANQVAFHDLRSHQQTVTRVRRQASCRSDHATWKLHRLHRLDMRLALGAAVERMGQATGTASVAGSVYGARFANGFYCRQCRRLERSSWQLVRLECTTRRPCSRCGSSTLPRAFDTVASLTWGEVTPSDRARNLLDWGFRAGDIVSLVAADGRTEHVALPLEPWEETA